MTYFDDAKALVEHAANEVPRLKQAYDASLHQQSIQPALQIEIKNIMENLRSALDFAARGLFNKYGSSVQSNPKIYFPYALLTQTRAEFQKSKQIENCIPGISKSRPDIVAKIESYQHYSKGDNRWLPLFMDLNNENKHERLTPQIREEARQLTLESEGASISLGPGSSITLGHGTYIKMGDMTIPGDQQISGEKPARYIGVGKQTVTIWVSFKFESNGEPVIPFLINAVDKTREIINELAAM